MRPLRLTLATLLLVTSFAFAPATAVAADPPTGPMTIGTVDFENPYPPPGFTAGINPDPPGSITPTAWWGRANYTKRTGTYGLWCAANSVANWNTYPAGTSGRASWELPQLADFYSSDLDFYYTMPSRGAADATSFRLRWVPVSGDAAFSYNYPYFSLAASWTQSSWALSDSRQNVLGNDVSLSRTGATLMWEFNDKVEGSSQTPTRGQGPTLDDISLTGYMYGPVRDLGTSPAGTGIELSWKKPYAAVGSLSVDSRAVEYRVWRRLETQPNGPWADITSGSWVPDSSTNVTYPDSSAVPGQTYRYRVIAYTPGDAAEYGEFAEVSAHVENEGVDVTAVPSYTLVKKGTQVEYTYTIKNTSAVQLTGLTVSDDLSGSITPVDTVLDPDQTTQAVSGPHVLTADTNNTVVVNGNAGGAVSDSETTFVEVNDPHVGITVTPAERLVNAGKTAVFDVEVANTGDAVIGPIPVTVNGNSLQTLVSLAPGASETLRYAAAVSSDTEYSFRADAAFGSPATPGYNGTVSATDDAVAGIFPSRIAGSDRIGTAIELSKQMFPGTLPSSGQRAVVIATGYGYADALAAASLAGAVDGPLLLVRQTSVPSTVADEIRRLGAAKAYIVGGTGVVSDGVRSYLQSTLGLTVERLAGATRYGTAAAVARETRDVAGAPSRVYVATGGAFPDALAASSLAAELAEPIVLTRTDALSPEASAVLAELKPSTIVVCGGTGAVSANVASQLSGSAYGSPSVIRKGGAARYDTAKLLAEYGESVISPAGFDGVFLATGSNFPDALAGGVAAAASQGWRPLMLTTPTSLAPQAASLISERDTVSFISVVGGTGAVSDSTRTSALGLVQ